MSQLNGDMFGGYLTVSEAVSFPGIPANTLRYWDRTGKMPAYRHPMNGYRLCDRRELEHLLKRLTMLEKPHSNDHTH